MVAFKQQLNQDIEKIILTVVETLHAMLKLKSILAVPLNKIPEVKQTRNKRLIWIYM